MRLRSFKTLPFLFVLLLIKILTFYYASRLFSGIIQSNIEDKIITPPIPKPPKKRLNELVTVILRDFELHENDVTLTLHSFTNAFMRMQIFLMYDELPYPPLDIVLTNNTLPHIKFIKLSPDLRSSFVDNYPISEIKSKYVLFVPDSTRVSSRQSLQLMVNALSKHPGSIVAAVVKNHRQTLSCLNVNINIREWNLQFDFIKSMTCDAVTGKHVFLLETKTLMMMSNAFLLPFPHSLYLQSSALNLKVHILKDVSFHEGKPLFRSHHAQWQQKQLEATRLKKLYNIFKIKKVIRETGITEWYGCTKETERCFGTVIDAMPSYLYERRWTPPCCLANLRKTAKHTFSMLDETGIRYWLEAGSLLGAMRNGEILPWDHNVDVGFIREDLDRCSWLKMARSKSVLDPQGFLWEKATEGNFYRVHFSKTNSIHVNLFPFYSKNGTMTKDSWYTHHKNMEFPEIFLHPMSSIEFVGRSVPSPNNIRDFLELKFGKGAIETPEYPDPSKLKFP
ncbi:ribitol 5-phosphate transferase FKRP [Diabrotica undecimpunctata]|uniref:ribitol 5-phosphate transferase FKRP n=1 Tax=Diabrotica undecimpunctata TaxID=50387 RepID=UPI003B63B4F1